MTRATIIGVTVATVLGATVLTATAIPALNGGPSQTAEWRQTMHDRGVGQSMMNGTGGWMAGRPNQAGMMDGTGGWMAGRGMHDGMMGEWAR